MECGVLEREALVVSRVLAIGELGVKADLRYSDFFELEDKRWFEIEQL